MIMFPTSGGDEEEYERQGLIGAIAEFIDAGRVKAFCVNVNHGDSFANRRAHPLHRSWMQRQYDEYIRHEVIPFVAQPLPVAGRGDLDDGRVARRRITRPTRSSSIPTSSSAASRSPASTT